VVYEVAISDLNAAPTEMMPRLAIGGTALAGSPADFGDDDIGVMQDGLVQERDHFEIETMSVRAKRM
jgi:hypothetical protein